MSLMVYLDLDRTLYRTDLSGQLIWQEVSRLYPRVDANQRQSQRDFYIHRGDLYAYDFSAHLVSLDLNPVEVYQQIRQSELADGRLEYKGVSDLVSWIRQNGEVKVLTYGVDDFQRLKAALCPSLDGVQVITVLKPKSDFFKNLELDGRVWMVDDKPIGEELPEGVRFIQVIHGGVEAGCWLECPIAMSLSDTLNLLQKSI